MAGAEDVRLPPGRNSLSACPRKTFPIQAPKLKERSGYLWLLKHSARQRRWPYYEVQRPFHLMPNV